MIDVVEILQHGVRPAEGGDRGQPEGGSPESWLTSASWCQQALLRPPRYHQVGGSYSTW